MINYELAKELKEAGFPQADYNWVLIKDGDGQVFLPTLSELIEACMKFLPKGNSFLSAYNSARDEHDRFWACLDGVAEARGATYEEAVAKLWLELNKKSP